MCISTKGEHTMLRFDDIKDIDDLNKLRDYFLEPLEPIIESVKEMPKIIEVLKNKISEVYTERRECFKTHMDDNSFLKKKIDKIEEDVIVMKKIKDNAPKILYEKIMKSITLILGASGVVGIILGLINFFIWTVLQLEKMGVIK
jgi:hypothetical protein